RHRYRLSSAAAHPRPCGRLVYAVCSGEPEEGEDVVGGFLASHPEFALARLPDWATPFAEGGFARTRPERDGRDSFFAAVVVKRQGGARGAPPRPPLAPRE